MDDRTISYDEFNAAPAPLIPRERHWMIAPIVFGGLTLLMFIDVLFTSSKVISHMSTDLALQFLPWRDFGFSEMAKGNLPLWNPHVFGGAPYLAGFQSALLYPPNWLHLFLPVPVAINWIVAIHVFLLGYFVYFWCRGNGVGISGGIVAGVMYMFCGPYFLHLYAGHLPHLAVMVWTPLMLLALDKLSQTGQWKWVLLGITATSMHILAGHPQYVYYTGMALTAYTLLKLPYRLSWRPNLWLAIGWRIAPPVLLLVVRFFGFVVGKARGTQGVEFLPAWVGVLLLLWGIVLWASCVNWPQGRRLAAGFAGMYIGAVLVTAVQLFSGIDAAGEGVRNVGLDYSIAATFSLAPANLVTLIAPNFFSRFPTTTADPTKATLLPYWGAGYLWELSLFVSVTGLVLAILAIVRTSAPPANPDEPIATRIAREIRNRHHLVLPLAMIVITLILALGRHTPLYRMMYDSLPGYNGFRGTVKFASLMMLFVTLLAGMGFDGLLRNPRVNILLVAVTGGVALLVFIIGGVISGTGGSGTNGMWGRYVVNVIASAQSAREMFNETLGDRKYDPAFITSTAEQAAGALFLAGGTLLAVTALLAMSRINRLLPYALMLLVIVEMFTFAFSTRSTMDPAKAQAMMPQPWLQIINQYRRLDKNLRFATVNGELANMGMYSAAPFNNLNGYDPGVLRHYAEILTHSQGGDRQRASQYLPWIHPSERNAPFLSALRCVLMLRGNIPVIEIRNPLPMVSLYGTWARVGGEDELLEYIFSGKWKPEETVLLLGGGNVPLFPTVGSVGSVRILNEGTDHLEIEATVDHPATMLVTNNYSKGWRVVPLIAPPEKQQKYIILRANYTHMGIPLHPGKHHLRLEYSPFAYRLGWWVSLSGLIVLATWTVLLMRRPGWFR